ncbi:hypothetical protein ACH5RR_000400 [Cinchona calisaya]|uniref:Uncharacterized protein n=1 Tax=Cinchona calisaya TaxID=153742 RepID=A0ABD3B1J7_9GENT
MAQNIPKISILVTYEGLFSLFLVILCCCNSLKSQNISDESLAGFAAAIATWYGPPDGAGTDGGACGYEDAVEKPPFSARVSAGNDALFKEGKGCGTCYAVKCQKTSNPACSGSPVRVVITDYCPGSCNADPIHFDLSGIAMGALAEPGQDDQLRIAGIIDVLYQRVQCNYGRQKIMFNVDKGANPFFFATLIEYQNGGGDLDSAEIKSVGSDQFLPMEQLFGATYKIDSPHELKGPFSIRLTQGEFKRSIVAKNVSCSPNDNPACSGNAVTITITDECPDACNNDPVHFDFSSTAFGYLAKSGEAENLRKAGRINVSYQRVACAYPNQNIVFKVDSGSNPNYFSIAIEYENGDGDLAAVEIQPSGSNQWFSMQQVFGVTYKYDVPTGTNAPFSIRLTQIESKKTIVAQNVIPGDWKAGSSYTSSVNF